MFIKLNPNQILPPPIPSIWQATHWGLRDRGKPIKEENYCAVTSLFFELTPLYDQSTTLIMKFAASFVALLAAAQSVVAKFVEPEEVRISFSVHS